MPLPNISLDGFVDAMKVDLDNFAKHYRAQNAVTPAEWPMEEFTLSDWAEQFAAFDGEVPPAFG